MHVNEARSWEACSRLSPLICFALYLRDCAGLGIIGTPAVSALKPAVHCADPRQTVHAVGGVAALRVEWEAWWYQLVSDRSRIHELPVPPDFPEFRAMPALQRYTHAHFGTALTWVRAWEEERLKRPRKPALNGHRPVFAELVAERELELGRSARNFRLEVVELPLSEPRAWFVEPDLLIMSEDLYDDEVVFRSYVQPVVEFIA